MVCCAGLPTVHSPLNAPPLPAQIKRFGAGGEGFDGRTRAKARCVFGPKSTLDYFQRSFDRVMLNKAETWPAQDAPANLEQNKPSLLLF